MSDTVRIKMIGGLDGSCLAIDDYRVAGPKPWGGGTVMKTWTAKREDVLRSIGVATDESCTWTPDEDGNYESTCGRTFTLIYGGPAWNHMAFCCYCGRRLVEAASDYDYSSPLRCNQCGKPPFHFQVAKGVGVGGICGDHWLDDGSCDGCFEAVSEGGDDE